MKLSAGGRFPLRSSVPCPGRMESPASTIITVASSSDCGHNTDV